MNTPLQATLWELWRTSRREFAVRVALHSLVAGWACGVGGDFFAAERDVLRGVMIMLLSIGSVFSVTWMSTLDNRANGFCFPLNFARPVSSRQLVLVPMLFTMAFAIVSFLIPAGLFWFFGGTTLPVLGISAGIACAVACFIATAWSSTTNIGRWISVVAVFIGLIALLAAFHIRREEPEPWLLVMGRAGYFHFTWYYYVMCVVVSAIAGAIAIIGVDRQRHGDTWHVFESVASLLRLPDRSARRARVTFEPFRDEFAAQFWCEMQRIGRVVFPFAICAPFIPLACVWSAPLFVEKAAIWRGTPSVWLMALILCPLVCHALGVEASIGLRRRHGANWLPDFDATTPMTSDRLTGIKLIAMSVCSLAGWLCMLLVAGLHSAAIGNWEAWWQIANNVSSVMGDVSGGYWFAGLSALALLYISSTSMVLSFALWSAKHERQLYIVVVVGMAHGTLALVGDIYKWNLVAYWTAAGYALAIGIVVVSGLTIWRAYTAGYFGKPLLQLTLLPWAIYVVSTTAFYFQAASGIASRFAMPLPLLAIAASTLLVPIASTAAAPVALDSHRHG